MTLIEDVSSGREARYAFIHEQIRQTLLSLLSTARRQRLHLRMADAMEALYGSEANAHAADIAYHLYQAGAAADGSQRTVQWLVRAAERALDALAFEDALRDLDAARTVLPPGDAEGAVRLLRLRAHALRGLTRIDDALAALAEAVAIAPSGAERDATLQARARLKLDLFRGQEALADLEPLLPSARQAGDRGREVDLLLMRSRGHYILSLDQPGYAEKTRTSYEQTYALAKEIGDKRAMCQALIPTSWFVDYWQECRDRALANNEEARALAADLGDEELQIEAATARLRLATLGEAHEEALRVRQRLEARRDPVRLKEHLFWLMWHHFRRGEFEQCVTTCDEGIAMAAQLGSPPVQYATGYPFQPGPEWIEHEARKRQASFAAPPCPAGQHPFIHELLSLFWDAPRVATVGEVMVYSNHNYALLGEIVRRLSGRALEQQARQRIFDPLGMRDSYYVVPQSEAPRVVQRAPGSLFGPDNPFLPDMGSRQFQEIPRASGGVFTTPLA